MSFEVIRGQILQIHNSPQMLACQHILMKRGDNDLPACLPNTSWVTIFLTDLRTFCMHNAAEFKSNVLIKLSLLVPT